MANPVLRILQPAHGAKIAGTGNVRLQAQLQSGSATGLFFKWYSTLNAAATAAHPELNATDHSVSRLDWTTPLHVGTHVITLSAADREGNDLASIKAVTRSGFAGGAPVPANPAPCVVHRLWATLRTPAADGANLSKALATIEARAPSRWGKETSPGSGVYVKDADYHALNGIRYRFRFEPETPDPARTAELTPSVDAMTFFIADNTPYVRWRGALPTNLGTGAYVLRLYVESLDGTVGHNVSRKVNLTA
jgi:hypothetical protein